jgi:hypothetical protein
MQSFGMPEFDTSWHAVKGPIFDGAFAREKLFLLLSLFNASRPNADLCDDGDGCTFRGLIDEFEEELITRLLIETAAMIRMKDDLFEQQHGIKAATQKDIVGKLFLPAKNPVGGPLNLREACNKIIHAKLINFDMARRRDWHARYFNPKIYLYGERGKQEWKAEVDIIRFVEFGTTMFP